MLYPTWLQNRKGREQNQILQLIIPDLICVLNITENIHDIVQKCILKICAFIITQNHKQNDNENQDPLHWVILIKLTS